MAPDALSLTDVHAFYGDSHILHGISFSLAPGAVLALLGRNGAGKTTCVSAIIGLLAPRKGEIRLYGDPIAGLAPERISRLGIGLVPQGRRVFPSLTVRENLIVAAQRRETGTLPWTSDGIYDLFPRLRERHTQFAGTLSGGEQQMLAIGRALMGNPRVLLLDEPSEGLAPLIVAENNRPPQGAKTVHRPGRTESQARPRCRRFRGYPEHRTLRLCRQGQRITIRRRTDRPESRCVPRTLGQPSTLEVEVKQ